jgi:hypothetical protein
MNRPRPKQPVVKVWLHSTGDASPLTALLLRQILPVFSVVAPCQRGASPVSVRRKTFTTGCKASGALVILLLLATGLPGAQTRSATSKWLTGWSTSQHAVGTAAISNATVRLIARVTISGESLRIRHDNTFGTAPVTVARA